MVEVRIYVEGGGDDNNTRTRCRIGFVKFFEKLLADCGKPRVTACGGRRNAFEAWQQGRKDHPDAFCILLVDSEDPVATSADPWPHLRRQDGWSKPTGATIEHCHLMVQCMEAWLVSDHHALADFYDGGFNEKKLPQRAGVETIPKEELYKKLEAATRGTKRKGAYSKGGHSFELLGQIDALKVEAASPHMGRLAGVLRKKLCKHARLPPPTSKKRPWRGG